MNVPDVCIVKNVFGAKLKYGTPFASFCFWNVAAGAEAPKKSYCAVPLVQPENAVTDNADIRVLPTELDKFNTCIAAVVVLVVIANPYTLAPLGPPCATTSGVAWDVLINNDADVNNVPVNVKLVAII